MPKIFAAEKAQTDYGHLFNQVIPDLQGYDEIHILTKENFDQLNLPKKEKITDYTLEEVAPLLKDSQLFGHLKSSGQSEQSQVLRNALASAIKLTSPHSFSVETRDGDKPYRVGFLVMQDADPQSHYQGLMIPEKLSSKDKQSLSFTKAPLYLEALRDFTFMHEVGHLVDNYQQGIKALTLTQASRTEVGFKSLKHRKEVAADNFAAGKMDDVSIKRPVDQILRQRTLDGTWKLISDPGVHFTEPFMESGVLKGVPYADVIEAGKRIAKVAEVEADKIFKENKSKIPKGDIKNVDRDNFGSFCMKLSAEVMDIGKPIKGKEREKGLKESFDSCAGEYFDYQVKVLSASRYHFGNDSLERKILDNYMTAVDAIGLGAKLRPSDDNNKPKSDKKQSYEMH